MINFKLVLFSAVILNLTCLMANAQIEKTEKLLYETSGKFNTDSLLQVIDSLKEITPSIELGSVFSNNEVFWGRSYILKQAGAMPFATYKNGKGLYIYALGYYLSKMSNQWNEFDLGIEYDKQFTNKSFGSIAYERWISNTGIKNDRGALLNNIEAKFNYDLNFISMEPCVAYMFGKLKVLQTDLAFKGDYQLFRFSGSGKVSFQPQFTITGATSSILQIVYENPVFATEKKNNFKIVSYNLALPIAIAFKNMSFGLSNNLGIPVKISNNESLKPFYYFAASVSYNGFFEKL